MRSYYSGVNIRTAFVFSERRAQIRFNDILPGRFDLTIPSKRLRDWSSIGVGVTLPQLPDPSRVRQALDCISWSFVLGRRLRARRNIERARRAVGAESESSLDSVVSQLEGRCIKCHQSIGPTDEAAACIRCPEMICTTCHPNLSMDFRCPAHLPPKRARSSR